MATSGNATGGNDLFSGKSRIFWWLVSQDPLAGSFGRSTIRWAWSINWAPGDNCHTILDGLVVGNGTTRYSNATVHSFNGSHVHTGDAPSVNSTSGGGFASGTYTIDHDSAGNANVVLSGSHRGTSGATSTASNTWALPQIPQDPADPTSLTNARTSDTQASLAWTNHSTSGAPYSGVKVYRQTDGGAWALIATLGVVTSYSDNTISANHKYNHRVSAVGANTVESGFATGTAFWTTPGAPTGCSAAKQPNNDVVVSWVNTTAYSEYLTEVQESTDGGSTWSNLATSIAAGTTSYTHVAPSGATTHTYRVRAKTSTGTPLTSAYSANSNTVTLVATANPPSGLTPAGVARDAAGNIVLAWTHNPADGTPQSAYRLQYKVDAGSYTTVGPTSSTTSSYTLPGGTVANGHTITWHVASAGQNGTLSAYSADATFTTSDRPTATLSAPTSSYTSSHLVAAWTYYQAQASPQATWQAVLLDSAGNVVESHSGTTETTAAFGTVLADGSTYTARVLVTSAAGLTSVAAEQTFTVTYLPPAMAYVAATYDSGSGCMVLTVTGDTPVGGVTVDIDTVTVQRSINGGPWVTIADGLVLVDDATTVLDTTPTIRGTNTYRAVALSTLPSSATSADEVVDTVEPRWCYLSAGPGFAQVVRMLPLPNGQAQPSRARALYHFADRELPVQFQGTAVDLVVSASATLGPDTSTVDEVEAMGSVKGVVLWRDLTGRRVFGALSLSTGRSNKRNTDVALTITQLDHTE